MERRATEHLDVLVIGGGGAGLRAAIEAAEAGAKVGIVSQSRVGYGSLTAMAGGAFASVRPTGKGDSEPQGWQQHFRDTVEGGRYLGDQSLARLLALRVPGEIARLDRFGVRLARPDAAPWLAYSSDPGHRAAAMIFGENVIGTDFTFPMRDYAQRQGVRFFEGMLVTKLLLRDLQVTGVVALSRDGAIQLFTARSTVLATGGVGQLFGRTDNSAGSTGDGYALAYEAGLPLRDMEFMQFYPLSTGPGSPGIFYEILVVGAGAKLLNSEGEDILARHGLTDTMSLTRDRVSQVVMCEVLEGRGCDGGVVLDLSAIPGTVLDEVALLLPKGSNSGKMHVWVAPTAHTHLGGVIINERTATSLKGLYAVGEVCGGVHGANRLSGNALSDLFVFGAIAGAEAAKKAGDSPAPRLPDEIAAAECRRLESLVGPSGRDARTLRSELRQIMWQQAGVIRSEEPLRKALGEIERLSGWLPALRAEAGQDLQYLLKTHNLFLCAEMLCSAALTRTESRGAHCRSDYPEPNDKEWLRSIVIQRDDGRPLLSYHPVEFPYLSPTREGDAQRQS